MRNFILRTLLFFAIQVLVCAVLYIGGRGDKSEDRHYLSSLIDKHERLDSMESPRLVFVGGSNLMFGVDSERIEKETGRATVNMGVNAALGLDFILSDIESKISSDDLVVLSLEYEFFLEDLAQSPSLWHALRLAPRNISGMGLGKMAWITDNGLYPIRQIVRHPFAGRPEMNELYSRDNVNQRGDIISRPEKYNTKIKAGTSVKPVKAARRRALSRVAVFRERCHKRGAEVVVMYPYVPQSYAAARGDFYSSVHLELNKKGFWIIGTPEEASLKDEYFYDTNYHLTKEGAAIRTGKIVSTLKPIAQSMSKD